MHLYIYGQLVLEPHETTCVICMFQEQHQLAADTSKRNCSQEDTASK